MENIIWNLDTFIFIYDTHDRAYLLMDLFLPQISVILILSIEHCWIPTVFPLHTL